jgi:hypothetical protein
MTDEQAMRRAMLAHKFEIGARILALVRLQQQRYPTMTTHELGA